MRFEILHLAYEGLNMGNPAKMFFSGLDAGDLPVAL